MRMVGVSCSVGSQHHPHTLILGEEGQVYSCGDGYKFKLGLGDTESREKPTLIEGLTDIVRVVTGGIHSAALDRNGAVWTWGCGSDGRLGHQDAEGHRYLARESIPRHVSSLSSPVSSLSSSYYHMAAVVPFITR